jgi:predicted negative regulator of RcsB-dependent stress response
MSAKSISKRAAHARHPDSEDVLMVRAMEFAAWAKGNVKLIVIGVVLFVVLVGGGLYYRYYAQAREQEASAELMKLQATVNSGNPQLAARDLEKFVHRFDGTSSAAEAQVVLAQMYLQENQAAKAVEALKGVDGRIGDSEVGPQAALLLAAAKNSAGDSKGAIETYLKVADEAPHQYQQAEALENAAVLRTQAGDFAGAAELYQRLIDAADAKSPQVQLYKMRLAEAQAKAEFGNVK